MKQIESVEYVVAIPSATELEITVDEFLIALRQAGHPLSTIDRYKRSLKHLLHWLAERSVEQPSQLTKQLLREWGASLWPDDGEDGFSRATIKVMISAARKLLQWCLEEKIITEPLASALKVPKVKNRVQRTLSDDEVIQVLDKCDTSTIRGKRDKALISLIVDSGLRASEVCRVRINDLNFGIRLWRVEVNFLTVITKGGDEELAYFGQETASHLKAWLEVRSAREGVEELFVSLGGITPKCALTRHGLWYILHTSGQQAGVPEVSPHALRRSFACLADEAGASSRKIMQWGRWSSIKMVEQYTMALKAGKHYSQHSPMDYLTGRI